MPWCDKVSLADFMSQDHITDVKMAGMFSNYVYMVEYLKFVKGKFKM